MVSIGGGRNQPSPHQRKLERYEQFVADYKDRVGEYPAMPIELSPNNGVPTGDTFHGAVKPLGVEVTVKGESNKELPLLTDSAYKQLLNTIASIVDDPLGFMRVITTIDLLPSNRIMAGVVNEHTIRYECAIPPKLVDILSEINPKLFLDVENTLRNPATIAEHEGIHLFFMGTLYPQLSKFFTFNSWGDDNDVDIFTEYIAQLNSKNPNLMAEAPKILSTYYQQNNGKRLFGRENNAQEFFSTLFEAYASEVASRTPITEEMADAVGNTVAYLEARKVAFLPEVSEDQRTTLKDLLSLVRETPLDVAEWVLYNSYDKKKHYDLFRQVSPNTPFFGDEKILQPLFSFMDSFNTNYPDTTHGPYVKECISELYPKMPHEHQSYVRTLASFINPSLTTQTQQETFIRESPDPLSRVIDSLTCSIPINTKNGKLLVSERDSLDRYLFNCFSREQQYLPTFLSWKKELLQKSVAVLGIPLDVPQQFIRLLDSIDEKELMITMLHRLV